MNSQDYNCVIQDSMLKISNIKGFTSTISVNNVSKESVKFTYTLIGNIEFNYTQLMASISDESLYKADEATEIQPKDDYQSFIEKYMDIADGESYIKPYSLVEDEYGNYELTFLIVNKQDNILEIPVLPIKIRDTQNSVIFQDFLPVNIYAIPYKYSVSKVNILRESLISQEFDLSTWDVKFESA